MHLTALDAALPAWRASGRAADAAGVTSALDGINAALAVHLPDEESNIVPVMETVITQKEVDALSEHGRKATPKGKMFVQLGAILAAQPDGGEEWQRKHLPAARATASGAGSASRSTRRTGRPCSGADAHSARRCTTEDAGGTLATCPPPALGSR